MFENEFNVGEEVFVKVIIVGINKKDKEVQYSVCSIEDKEASSILTSKLETSEGNIRKSVQK